MAELTELIRALYEREMTAASSTGERRCDGRTSNAHIVSQPYPWLHTGNHVAMFRWPCDSTTAARCSARWSGLLWPTPARRWGGIRRATTGGSRRG